MNILGWLFNRDNEYYPDDVYDEMYSFDTFIDLII